MADMDNKHQVHSEVGRLKTVIMHRPGHELKRLTPRNNDSLLFDGIPWVDRAQAEHDDFANALRRYEVEVLYVQDLLRDTLDISSARDQAVDTVLADRRLGDSLRANVQAYLSDLDTDALASTLVGGLAHEELRGGKDARNHRENQYNQHQSGNSNLLFQCHGRLLHS